MLKRVTFIFFTTLVVVIAGSTLLSASTPNAPSSKLSGFIRDKNTGRPIPDANIMIEGTSYGVASQDGGFYFFQNLPDGTYNITVRVVGYENGLQNALEVQGKTSLDFYLQSKPIQVDPILVTATGTDHLQSQVTVTSEVLTLRRMTELSGNTIGEIAESVTGMYTRNYDGFAGPQTPSIRGSNTDQVLYLLDGIRLNTAQGGGIDLNNFPVETIDRVEIVRGGHSALMGTDAIGGVIHLISKHSHSPKGYSFDIRSTQASFSTQTYTVSNGFRVGSWDTYISYHRSASEGDFEYEIPETGETTVRQNNDYESDHILVNSILQLGNKNRLQMVFQSINSERGVIGSIAWPSPSARREEDRKLVSLQSENQISDKFRLKEKIYYQSYDNHYQNPEAWIPEDDLHETKIVGADFQGRWSISSSLTGIAGLELRSDKLESTRFSKKDRNTTSAYVQGEISHPLPFLSGWRGKWIPAIRWDNYSDVDSHTCPKLGVLFTTGSDTKFSIKGNVGQSFRAPAFFDLYWPEDDFTVGNPDLKPELSTNVDFGFSYNRNRRSYLQWDMTYFRNDFEDLILWEPRDDWKWTPRNVGQALIQGLENTITFRLPDNRAHIRVAYTRMKATDETKDSSNKGNRLIYRPDNKLDISVGARIRILQINLSYRIVDESFVSADNETKLPDYNLLNGNVSAHFKIGTLNLDAKFQILNLLDKSVFLMDGYPLPGREIRISLGIGYN